MFYTRTLNNAVSGNRGKYLIARHGKASYNSTLFHRNGKNKRFNTLLLVRQTFFHHLALLVASAGYILLWTAQIKMLNAVVALYFPKRAG